MITPQTSQTIQTLTAMKKKVYNNATINMVLQQETEVSTENCPKGIISKDENGDFRFEEEIRKGRAPRNPKLFDGNFISMVRMQNGKYQCHLKTFNPTKDLDRQELAFKVYSELLNALNILD